MNAYNMATYFNEKTILSFWIMLKMYLLNIVSWVVPYIFAYLIWCDYLCYNWPIPYLGYLYVFSYAVRPAFLWTSLPRYLRAKEKFKNNFQLYILLMIASLLLTLLREGISVLFKVLPGYLQWIVAILIPLIKQLDTLLVSKVVGGMTGGRETASKALLGIAINSAYSFFIAVRLPNAEIITICFIIAIDFLLQLHTTYKIYRFHNMVNDERNEKMVTKLVLAEITEGITPIVYATGITMAYYGSNGHIPGNVKNRFWGYRAVKDVEYLAQIMFLLLGVDILSVLVNFFILSATASVDLFREICRIMKSYWHFIAVKFAEKMCLMFLIRDINLGMDTTGAFNWITNNGRTILINGSTDLSHEEKFMLLNQTIF